MRHIGQELRFTSIRQFSSFSSHRILLQTVTQREDHLVDFRLERIHFSRRLDRDERTEISFRGGGGNLGECSDL